MFKRLAVACGIFSCALLGMGQMASADPIGHEYWIHGRVANFSAYSLDLRRGPHVELHPGTVINPTGITLQPGMRIAIRGHRSWQNHDFVADEIDVRPRGPRY